MKSVFKIAVNDSVTKKVKNKFINYPFVTNIGISLVGEQELALLACFGVAMECVASKCANARWPF
jgi:hypothetical protein